MSDIDKAESELSKGEIAHTAWQSGKDLGFKQGLRQAHCESKKLFDDTFGSHYIQEGNYRKRLDCDLGIKNENMNVVNSVLTQLRAKPTIWQANPTGYEFDNLIIYGIPRSFDILMEDINYTECSLEIDGLI